MNALSQKSLRRFALGRKGVGAVVSGFLALTTACIPALADGNSLLPVVTACATDQMGLLALSLPKLVGHCVGEPWAVPGLNPQDQGLPKYIKQHTSSGGLLVQCMFSDWTAFTDGQMTYIGGPFGMMWRKNNAVLPYPYDQACTPPPPPGGSAGDPSGGDPGSSSSCVNNISIVNGPNSTSVNSVAAATCGSNASVHTTTTAPTSSGGQSGSSGSTGSTSGSGAGSGAPSSGTSSAQTSSIGSGSGSTAPSSSSPSTSGSKTSSASSGSGSK